MSAVPDSVKLEAADCPLCGPAPSAPVLTGHDLMHDLPGDYPIVACTTCGLLRTNPRPTPDTVGFYYPADYGPYLGTQVTASSGGTPSGLKAGLVALGKWLFNSRAQAIPPMPAGRLLEIGCASGSYLHAMAGQGWQVQGIEYSPEAAETARKLGHHVETGAVETIDKAPGQYDLIAGWMVLEHLHQPLAVLGKLRLWVKPGGKLVVSVPNAGGFQRRLFGANWHDLHLPNHLYHYDPKSIRRLMAAAGWRVTAIHHHRTLANAVASAGYALRDRSSQQGTGRNMGTGRIAQALIDFPEKGGRIGALAVFPFAWIAALLGQTGRMTVWAEPA
ncbi:MAG: class I SAM-dependent methyltransferase [Novosphingobium sp.]